MKWEIRSSIRRRESCVDLSKKEREVLDEKKIKNGESIKILIPVNENLKNTFRVAAKVWGLKKYSVSTQRKQYKDFLSAKNARNRLTHPRTYYDIMVTDSDMHCYVSAFFWVKSDFLSLWDERIEILGAELPMDIRKQRLSLAESK
jgi:hypothetical protein